MIRTRRLPIEYQEVEWIGGSGSQYIDTLLNGQSITEFEIDAYAEPNGSMNSQVIGGTNSSAVSFYGIRVTSNTRWYVMDTNGVGIVDGTHRALSHLKIESPRSVSGYITDMETNIKYTNVAKLTSSSDWAFPDENLRILSGASSRTSPNAKVYLCKLWVNDDMVRFLVPCYRKSDNAIGMFDMVSLEFFTNAGTGTFTKGSDVVTQDLLYVGGLKKMKMSINNEEVWKSGILPSEYQEVEYIQTNGGTSGDGQYIDSGLTLNNNSKVEMIVQINELSGYSMNIFGGRGTTTDRPFSMRVSSGYWGVGWYNATTTTSASADLLKHRLVMDGKNLDVSVDGTSIRTLTSATFTTPRNCGVGCVMAVNSYPYYVSNCKIYSFKLWQDGETLSRYFIPCYRIADNVIGMYDLVSKVFFTNAGTGTFTKGADV